jgi:hypothetical protein
METSSKAAKKEKFSPKGTSEVLKAEALEAVKWYIEKCEYLRTDEARKSAVDSYRKK